MILWKLKIRADSRETWGRIESNFLTRILARKPLKQFHESKPKSWRAKIHQKIIRKWRKRKTPGMIRWTRDEKRHGGGLPSSTRRRPPPPPRPPAPPSQSPLPPAPARRRVPQLPRAAGLPAQLLPLAGTGPPTTASVWGEVVLPPHLGGGASSPRVGGRDGVRRWRSEGEHCSPNVGWGGLIRGTVGVSLSSLWLVRPPISCQIKILCLVQIGTMEWYNMPWIDHRFYFCWFSPRRFLLEDF